MAAMLSTEIPVIQEIPHLEESIEINEIPKITVESSYKETPGTDNEPPYVYTKLELITPKVNYTIPTSSCIYYKNEIFTFESLEHDKAGKYVSQKFKEKATYFNNRVNNTFLEISITDAQNAYNDFTAKNNFTVIFGSRACCEGYRITKFCFNFEDNNMFIEQESCWGCDNYIDTFDTFNFPINENHKAFQDVLETSLEFLKNRRKDLCIRAADRGNIEELRTAHKNGSPLSTWVCNQAAIVGSYECLEYAFNNGAQMNAKTSEYAARGGNIKCLKLTHKNGVPWDKNTTFAAAERGKIQCFIYAYENGCELHPEASMCAANFGHLNILHYYVKKNIPFSKGTYRQASKDGLQNKCVEFLTANGCVE